MILKARSLRKAAVPSSLIQNPSPGNLQSTRLALHFSEDDLSCWVYIASGSRVFKLQVSMEDKLVNRGKEGLVIPVETQVLESLLLNRCPHRSEIQSIVLSEVDGFGCLALGSVDSYGRLIVSVLDSIDSDVDRRTFSIESPDAGVGEGSWAGLCFSPSHWSMAAVARSFCKSIDFYDQDIHIRTLNTLWYPSSLSFIRNISERNSSLLAVGEGCQLSIWDMRMQEKGGCVRRICGSPGQNIYSISCSSTGNIAVGGADRTVTIYDPRRWATLSRWVHCTKYDITGLAFSSTDPNHVYIQGVDYEVLCGDWKDRRTSFFFKGDSNWLGFSKCSNKDVIGGWCDSGNLFLAEVY
ncbi:unnamed protein product [Rhodiola kirilowii]